MVSCISFQKYSLLYFFQEVYSLFSDLTAESFVFYFVFLGLTVNHTVFLFCIFRPFSWSCCFYFLILVDNFVLLFCIFSPKRRRIFHKILLAPNLAASTCRSKTSTNCRLAKWKDLKSESQTQMWILLTHQCKFLLMKHQMKMFQHHQPLRNLSHHQINIFRQQNKFLFVFFDHIFHCCSSPTQP